MSNKRNDPSLFQLDEVMRIAKNADSSPNELELIVNRNHVLNRILAAHPNSTASILSALIRFEEEESGFDEMTRRIAIRHPNISSDDALNFGNLFPDDLFENPAIDLIVAEYPRLISEDNYSEDNYSMLQAVKCPLSVLTRMAVEGTRAEQAAVARNPSLPRALKNELSSDYFYKRDVNEILKIAAKQDDDVLRRCIEMYANTSRPFCIPQFLPFDRKNSQHRLEDQIFSGFPFTSEEFPWPTEKLGKHMQPIAQIDLKKASLLLGMNIGGGLLQVWGGVESLKKIDLMTRCIPESSLANELDWFYPEYAPWLDNELNFDGCVQSAISNSDFPNFGIDNCRIVWRFMGQMFYPSVRARVFDPKAADRIDHEICARKHEFDIKLEAIEEDLDAACISRHATLKDAWGEAPLVVLGGYAESIGNTWHTYKDDMLFYHSLDYGVMITIGVTYGIGKDGNFQFSVNWTCDN